MSEEAVKDDAAKIFSKEEIFEMFDSGFLAKAQIIAARLKEERFKDKKIAYYVINMVLQFEDTPTPLTYSELRQKINLQLHAVLQEDLDKMEADKADKESKDDHVNTTS